MAVSTTTTRVATLTANVSKASKPTPRKPVVAKHKPGTTPANCEILNVNPAIIDYTGWKPAALKVEYSMRFAGHAAPTNKEQLIDCLKADAPTVPTMKVRHKARMQAEYRAAMRCEPTKSWNAVELAEAIKNNRMPGARRNGTVAEARKLISAAILLGVVSREDGKGRSAWKAEQVHAFVATHKLRDRIQVVELPATK